MPEKIAKTFIVTGVFFLLLGCIEGIMFPTKFQFQKVYTLLLHLPANQFKTFFAYFVTKIHTHVNLLGWVGSSLMGILYFLAPRISGAEHYCRWAAWGNWFGNTFGLLLIVIGFHLIGIYGLSSGFSEGTPEFREVAAPFRALVTAGGIMVAASAALFAWNILRTLLTSPGGK
jgi:cbb3-type cytochrome oxidase subunit 1